MAKIKIEFDTDNDCFDADPDAAIADIMEQVAFAIGANENKKLRDMNGNTVGSITIE